MWELCGMQSIKHFSLKKIKSISGGKKSAVLLKSSQFIFKNVLAFLDNIISTATTKVKINKTYYHRYFNFQIQMNFLQ